MKLYSYERYDKAVYFASKIKAKAYAQTYSRDCGHVVELREHTLADAKRSDLIAAAANREFIETKVIAAWRKGITVKGWVEAYHPLSSKE